MPPTTLVSKAADEPVPAAEAVHVPEPVPVPAPVGVPEVEMPAAPPALPPVIDDQPVQAGDWREDTREFAPIVMPETIDEPEPSAPIVEEPAERVLQRTMPGHESRDFDWGE